MSRAVVFSGHESWEERELPVPEPPIGGAVLRVESTGLRHSDVDHFRGNIHTSWGGAFPSLPGHEIVVSTRSDQETAAEGGVERVREITNRQMVDVVIDVASGGPETVNPAMDPVHNGGHVVLAGMKDGPHSTVSTTRSRS